jgi:hypothetical protein
VSLPIRQCAEQMDFLVLHEFRNQTGGTEMGAIELCRG